jgi:hypothetical protein
MEQMHGSGTSIALPSKETVPRHLLTVVGMTRMTKGNEALML